MNPFQIFKPASAILALLLCLPAALADDDKLEQAGDPLEALNRLTSGFNAILRKGVIDPVVDIYQFVTPDPIENAISNAASNLGEPITAGSSLLQGDMENAGNAIQRFLVNTSVGIGGLGDPATDMGIEARREDLGQALGAHGVGSGPHLVLPLLGPSNFRDLAGDLPLLILNPLPPAGTVAKGAVDYSGRQETVQAVGDGAIDRYIAEREAYEQNREYEIKNGVIAGPSFDEPANR